MKTTLINLADKRQLVVILGLTAGVFFRVRGYSFLAWDDDYHLSLNAAVRNFDLISIWSKTYYGLYIPLTYSVWSFLWWIAPSSSALFHLFNLILHLVNVALLDRLLLHYGVTRKWALLVALGFFAIHPLQVDAVAWVSGGRDILATFFGLIAWLFRGSRPRGALLAFALGLLCKPSIAFLPMFFLFEDTLIHRQNNAVRNLISWLPPVITVFFLTRLAQQDYIHSHASMLNRAIQSASTLLIQFSHSVFPVRIKVDYGISNISRTEILFALVLVASSLALTRLKTLDQATRRKIYGGFGFFVLALLPLSGIFPMAFHDISWLANHYLYFPLAGLSIAFGLIVNSTKSRVQVFIATVTMIVLATLTHLRLPIFTDDSTFFGEMVSQNPLSFSGHTGLGKYHLDLGAYQEAVSHFSTAHRLQPDSLISWVNLAVALQRTGNHQSALDLLKATPSTFSESRLVPDQIFVEYQIALASSLVQVGRPNEAEEAICVATKRSGDSQNLLKNKTRLESILGRPLGCN